MVKDISNHFVDAGLKGFISTIIHSYIDWQGQSAYWRLWSYTWEMYLGSDTGAATTTGMTALTTPIGGAPGTTPNSKSRTVTDGSGDGIWEAIFHATWNTGTVSGTLGELALYLKAPTETTYKWAKLGVDFSPTEVMVSRLASADTDFNSFAIDTGVPLTVDWTVQFAFV